jgi:hypothetical protein
MASPLANPSTQAREERSSEIRVSRSHSHLDLPAPLRLWHLASLDAPTVAVVWSLSFAHAANIHLPRWVPVLLALTTWAVYIGDRLLDAASALRSGDLSHLRERHYFHWTHRRLLLPCAILAATASVAIVFLLMPAGIRGHDSILAAAALVYFSGTHISIRSEQRRQSLFSKEFFVGVLFTAGCALPTLSRLPSAGASNALPLLAAFAFFAMLAWLNCYAIDRWEAGTHSAVTVNASVLGTSGIVLAFIYSSAHTMDVPALLLQGSISVLGLALLDRFRDRMRPLTLRAAADLTLLTPLILFTR